MPDVSCPDPERPDPEESRDRRQAFHQKNGREVCLIEPGSRQPSATEKPAAPALQVGHRLCEESGAHEV